MKRLGFLIVSALLCAPFLSFAYPYSPGETLQPACSPTTLGCTVTITEIARGNGAPGFAFNPNDPTDPVLYVNETTGDLYTWNGIQWNQISGGGSGWSLSGNLGTTAGLDFLGTTDAEDFMIKVNGIQTALFGQMGNIAFGNFSDGAFSGPDGNGNTGPAATGQGSMTWGGSTGGYDYPWASGLLSTAWGVSTLASDAYSTAWGDRTIASAENATAFGTLTVASGTDSTAFGQETFARAPSETAIGLGGTDYSPLFGPGALVKNRLFTIGNGGFLNTGTANNAYTLWADGSFAYNDSDFRVNSVGTEQNSFYFNYGNHDGEGNTQTKKAIRLGSTYDTEWDIGSMDVGDRSIALGFADFDLGNQAPIASGYNSIALGATNRALGSNSFAAGIYSTASGDDFSVAIGRGALATAGGSFGSMAFGFVSQALGVGSISVGNNASTLGSSSMVFGVDSTAWSAFEVVTGSGATLYTPNSSSGWDGGDRQFVVGNGLSSGRSDAFTILKNGKIGVAIDNFEAVASSAGSPCGTSLFQVGDGDNGAAIGCVDPGTGDWATASDQRLKDNIMDIRYGLDTVLMLSPKEYDFKRNGEHAIGFVAQDVQGIVPEVVIGTDYLGISYASFVPILTKAIQELHHRVSDMAMLSGSWGESIKTSLRSWLSDASNGIQDLFVKKVHVEQLCVGTPGNETCLSKEQVDQLLGGSQTPVMQAVVPEESTLSGENNSDTGDIEQETLSEEVIVPAEPVVEEISGGTSEPAIVSETQPEALSS